MRKILCAPTSPENFSDEELSVAVNKAREPALDKWRFELIDKFKGMEQDILDEIEQNLGGDLNDRWMAIGRTNIQQGFMAIYRAIAKVSPAIPTAKPITWDESEPLLGAAIRAKGLTGDGEENY